MNQFYKTLFSTLIISLFFNYYVFAQNNSIGQDSTKTDSILVSADSSSVSKEDSSKTDDSYFKHKDLINTNFGGFSNVMRTNESIQVFDFMEPGQPRFVAPINMFPHQAANIVDGFSRNEYTNGMFNTRYISLDQVESIRHRTNQAFPQPQSFNAKLRRVQEEDAFTRLKFYEGDFNYTDLDILFARNYTDNLRIGLAGFNKGYGGSSALNNSHTGVAYDTYAIYQIDKSTRSEFTWRLNRERSGVHKRGFASNFSYAGFGNTFGMRFIFDADSLSGDKATIGVLANSSRHGNRSKADSFEVKQHSDDYTVYLAKDFSTAGNKFSTRFAVENHRIWGNAFDNGFSETRFSLNLSDKFIISEKSWLEAAVELEQLNDFDPNLNLSFSSTVFYSSFFSRLSAVYSNRYPTPVERRFSYESFEGNDNLKTETFADISFIQGWKPVSFLSFKSAMGASVIGNEVLFTGTTFQNKKDRSWGYLTAKGGINFWRLYLSAGGHILAADQTFSAKQMFWGQLSYHDYWFNTVMIDATANLNWYSQHDAVYYNPILNRFYGGAGENPSYSTMAFKIVGTVSDAEIFLEMDNFLNTEVQFIEGYKNDLWKVRFGVNWVLWE
ncbi:MAG: hypothetical protein D8M58_20365 [Calditrichaeota bacterium]|nr:MAG: hypothetical protein DWQ03_14350 [Calditrichota bacterium]MBL1207765.1 hypothetical protein [Calditrichota bacterium]NOG47598.1 hypothetical protein [Calditrichota bacterium]